MPITDEIANPLDRPVWGAENFASIINRSVSQTFNLLERGKLDATKVDRLWTSTPRRLLASLGVSP
jgi:hypothetical protein